MTAEPFRIVVELIAREEPGQPPGAIRMRRALKTLLRCYGIRARWATLDTLEAQPATESQDPQPEDDHE